MDIDSTSMQLARGSSTYYSDNFGTDDVFWLARIIHAEAANQPLAGQIGVGNVVFNRVASEAYPDSVYDVIFDREHSIQFEPVMNGTVYSEPDEQSVIAAYLCFEGYNTVGEALFFQQGRYGANWISQNTRFVINIADHNFFL